jgi:hypothetical protein
VSDESNFMITEADRGEKLTVEKWKILRRPYCHLCVSAPPRGEACSALRHGQRKTKQQILLDLEER